MNTHLTPESKVLNFGFEVAHVGDLRAVFTKEERKHVSKTHTYCVTE